MTRILPALAAAALLAGCSTSGLPTVSVTTPATATAPATTATLGNPLAQVAAFTDADLANAISIAAAAGPTGAPIVSCFTFVRSQLANLNAATPPTGTIGIATAFTVADLALNNLTAATGPAAQTAYAMACGPLVTLTVNQGLSLQAQIAALVALIAK